MIPRIPTIVSPRRGFARVVEAPGPVLGTISDLAAVAGDGQVTLSWTAAANATSHQPQYRAQGSGTWLNFGSALGGATSGVTVTGLTNGQAYECQVVASDGVSQTFSNVVTATPTAPPAGSYTFGPGANEPATANAFFSWSPADHGVNMQAAHGGGYSGSGISMSAEWADRMSIVPASEVPGGAAMEQVWPTGTGTRSGNCTWGWGSHVPNSTRYPGWSSPLGALRELYVRFMVMIPGSWTRNPGNAKFIGFTMQDEPGSNNLDTYLQYRRDTELWYRFQCQANGGVDNREFEAIAGQTFGPGRDQWHEFEILLRAQSAPGAFDGEFHVWMDGNKVTQWQRIGGSGGTTTGVGCQFLGSGAPGTRFTHINVWPFYNGGSAAPKPKTEYLYWGGLYLSGRS